MDRKALGELINVNLAIQGQIEDVKSKLAKAKGEKSDADSIVGKGVEAKVLSDKLAKEISKQEADLKALEDDLKESDSELTANNAKVPRLINEQVTPPTHIRF